MSETDQNSLYSYLSKIPSTRILWIMFILGFLATIIISVIMNPIETELKANTPYGIMELEFMWTVSQAKLIVAAWGSILIERELFVTYLDFLFMLSYACLLGGASLIIARNIKDCSDQSISLNKIEKLGYLATLLPWIAVIFDIIENINIIIILTNPENINSVSPLLTSICASIKFSFLIATLIYIAIGICILILKKIKR